MAIDPTQIELSPEQKARLAELAEQRGGDYSALIDHLLLSVSPLAASNGDGAEESKSVLDVMEEIGAIGCFEGPGDLSTNPKRMEGFGRSDNDRHNLA